MFVNDFILLMEYIGPVLFLDGCIMDLSSWNSYFLCKQPLKLVYWILDCQNTYHLRYYFQYGCHGDKMQLNLLLIGEM